MDGLEKNYKKKINLIELKDITWKQDSGGKQLKCMNRQGILKKLWEFVKVMPSDRYTVERASLWDKTLGEESLISLMKEAGMADILVDFLCEKKMFDEAYEIANESVRHKLEDIHLHMAINLEDDKRY